jgi:carbonic anhydrase/acetyltransferase-like protein (isoleucine patch superfamily)
MSPADSSATVPADPSTGTARITLVNLPGPDAKPLAGLSVRDAALALLEDAGLFHADDPALPAFRFDARYLTVPAGLLAQVAHLGGRLTDGPEVVFAPADGEAEHPDTELPGAFARTIDDPLGAGVAERAVVDRLLSELDGVVLHDPARIWIEAGVTVAAGAELWPGVVLRGATRIGRASIGAGCVLTDTEVADGATVKPYTVSDGARIGPDSAVGPMAHLRTGAVLESDVKVGNFVEVKKTTLRAGAKASHLTYLGDAEIGANANIGAGTITCNYDGYNKWRTTIGAGAFVGSNTALVAPISIGAGAIVGAGSTVSSDVPDDALVVERADVRLMKGTAVRLRRKNQRIKEDRAREESG